MHVEELSFARRMSSIGVAEDDGADMADMHRLPATNALRINMAVVGGLEILHLAVKDQSERGLARR